jgi:hypothetical protein
MLPLPRWLATFMLLCSMTPVVSDAADDALAIFEQRILPILNSPKPSSCAECHLSGVDLKDYIRPTQAETFAALVQADLVDTKDPDRSKLLEFIRREPKQKSLVSVEIRRQEAVAFTAWIRAAVADPALKGAQAEGKIGPAVPVEVVRHARQDRVLDSFVEHVWSEVLRCAACHSPQLNQKQVKEHGPRVSWIVPDKPAETLQKLLDAGIIDVDNPAQSLLLTKPTMQVKHGGGRKMEIGDRGYLQFRAFLDDYAATATGKYRSTADLPKPAEEIGRATDVWLKLTGVPAEWDAQLLQVDLYRADMQSPTGWSEARWATSDRAIFGKGQLWQHTLIVTAPRSSPRANAMQQTQPPALPRGKYLVKILVDPARPSPGTLPSETRTFKAVGEVVVDSAWPTGYGRMTVAAFPASTK